MARKSLVGARRCMRQRFEGLRLLSQRRRVQREISTLDPKDGKNKWLPHQFSDKATVGHALAYPNGEAIRPTMKHHRTLRQMTPSKPIYTHEDIFETPDWAMTEAPDEGMTNEHPILAYLVFGPGKVSLRRLLKPIKAAV
jgi:hypothetical protein